MIKSLNQNLILHHALVSNISRLKYFIDAPARTGVSLAWYTLIESNQFYSFFFLHCGSIKSKIMF